MLKSDSKAAQWIAKHALHELQSDKVQKLLTKKLVTNIENKIKSFSSFSVKSLL